MAATARKSQVLANPFYLVLLIASTLFVVTALGYLVAPTVLDQVPAAPGRAAQNALSKAAAAWLDRNAPLALGIEFAVMLATAILAMLTDNWFGAARKPPTAGQVSGASVDSP